MRCNYIVLCIVWVGVFIFIVNVFVENKICIEVKDDMREIISIFCCSV